MGKVESNSGYTYWYSRLTPDFAEESLLLCSGNSAVLGIELGLIACMLSALFNFLSLKPQRSFPLCNLIYNKMDIDVYGMICSFKYLLYGTWNISDTLLGILNTAIAEQHSHSQV